MKNLLALALIWLMAPALSAQAAPQTPPSPQMQAAGRLFQAQDWPAAAKAYEEIVKADPANGRAWYQLGMARFSQQQFRPAIEAFEKNIAIANNPNAMYNAACAYARLGEKAKAMEWLTKAAAGGLSPFLNMAEDPDLVSLRDDPAFKELLTSLDKKRRPCMYSTEARQFDFWVGEWDVLNPQGQKAGTSSIQQVAEGCAIYENWKATAGGTGKSLNFYDPNAKKWYQYWIGPNGMPVRYAGVFQDGAMRYETEPAVINGKPSQGRLTFFHLDANTVRQLAEQTTDEGKTWAVQYDFKYVRKSAGTPQ